ncbi:MAG: N-6 DNA methylase [Nibricoccus sp.]
MPQSSLIDTLGYGSSPKFITPVKAKDLPASELSFALRHTSDVCRELTARQQDCRFHGTYVLQEKADTPAVPVVYVFETESDTTAREIHKIVWNQNLVPFIIIFSRTTVRVYPGFIYKRDEDRSLLSVARLVGDTLSQVSEFSATAIDEGLVWKRWGHEVDPSARVDETLLRHLRDLDQSLQEHMPRDTSHGLIGKFVYLYYLRHREILSDRKLKKWGVDPSDLFSRNATLKAFRTVNDQLQEWLNGSVFKLGEDSLANISQAQLRLVAGVFSGDAATGQLHLDFRAYDFSHIPIETLSCVYEQFLHDRDKPDEESRGKTLGAYYTPIALADYVIAELEQKLPLREGMRVLDPSCGSGIFLVQCYRRLIEKRMRSERRSLTGPELRELLVKHIFGIDRDDDACRVAELSLVLTLLDYINPPDLESTTFKLPTLRQSNIFKDDFFDTQGAWQAKFSGESFDWVVGNPPWAEVRNVPTSDHEHYFAGRWITAHKASHPTGGNQIAEAFLWKTNTHLNPKGVAGLLVPAMTWFKKESVAFRRQFFGGCEVWCVANFANLSYVLFAGRAKISASAVFFKGRKPAADHVLLTFAPFVVEQVANRPQKPNRQVDTWNIVVNGAELQEVDNLTATQGNGLHWKLAMWGCSRDERLFQRLRKRFGQFGGFAKQVGLFAHEGLQLRVSGDAKSEKLEHHPELAGKLRLNTSALRGTARLFSFPAEALDKISANESYVRAGRSKLPTAVSEPPHIVLDASRRFAVFSKEFIAIPPRQVGIGGPREKENLLRALSLFLSSDFCIYHQFFASPQWGIDMNRADLDTLKELPVPLVDFSAADLNEWSELQKDLASQSAKQFNQSELDWNESGKQRMEALIEELNKKVFKALGPADERALVGGGLRSPQS